MASRPVVVGAADHEIQIPRRERPSLIELMANRRPKAKALNPRVTRCAGCLESAQLIIKMNSYIF